MNNNNNRDREIDNLHDKFTLLKDIVSSNKHDNDREITNIKNSLDNLKKDSDKKFDSLNDKLDARFDSFEEKIDELNDHKNRQSGWTSAVASFAGVIVAVATLVISYLGLK